MKRSYQRGYELIMAHAFFTILEREPDFLTLAESAFSLHIHRSRVLGRRVYESNLDQRNFDLLFTAVMSL